MLYEKVWFHWPIAERTFFIVIYHSSLVKGAMNAACVCKLRNVLKKFSFFNGQRWTKCAMNILRSFLN
jgi:hypothetical protein